jgi:integration host factor subunit beta
MVNGCTGRAEIIKKMKQGLPELQDATEIYDSIIEKFKIEILRGNRIELRGFGVFYSQDCKGYRGHNPRNSQTVEVRPKRKVRFKVGRNFKKLINTSKNFSEIR